MSEGSAPEAVDQIVSGTILTMDGARRVIADGAVAIRGGTSVAVGPAAEIAGRFTAPLRRGGSDAIVLPGFLDCHTHATQALLRGLIAGELPMIYRLYLPADMALSPEEAHVAAKLCAVQLARSGVTTVCAFETNVSDAQEEAVLSAMRDVGVRCHFLRSRGDQEMHHAALYAQIGDRSWRRQRVGEAAKDLARTADLIARHADDEMVFVGVCPSGLTGFSDDYFREAHALAVEVVGGMPRATARRSSSACRYSAAGRSSSSPSSASSTSGWWWCTACWPRPTRWRCSAPRGQTSRTPPSRSQTSSPACPTCR